MAGLIRDSDIAAVRERASIVDIVGEYVALRRAGADSSKGLCPFHEERTPSFHVSGSRGTYHCFGCGVGGDVIDFIRRIENQSFVEAVERLAGQVGITLVYEGGSTTPRRTNERQRIAEANKLAAEFYVGELRSADAEPARQFLAERGFDEAAAHTFGCGFAPLGWDGLSKYLLGKGFSPRELVGAGLAKEARSGSLIDRFRRRLLWPIRSISGDVVGFGARRIFDDDELPKYLNTPETLLYKKAEVLYGVDLAKRAISRSRQAVVVEGYTDVMAAHLAGVPTAVASCGTAFGAQHISILRRLLMDSDYFRGEVIYTFDGDTAGQKAALRAFGEDQRFVAQTFVAVERSGLDPCELRQQHGDAAVRDLVARREPLVAFAIRSIIAGFDLDSVEGRVGALRAAAPLVARIKDHAMRPEYARKLAGDLGMEIAAVVAEVRRAGDTAVRRPPPSGFSRRDGGSGRNAGAGRDAHRTGGGGSGGDGSGGDGSGGDAGLNSRADHVSSDGPDSTAGSEGDAGPGGRSARAGPDRANGSAGPSRAAPAAAAPSRPLPDEPRFAVEREVLKLAVQYPVLAGPLLDEIGAEAFTHPAYAEVRRAVLVAGGVSTAVGGPSWVESLRAAAAYAVVASLVSELAVEPARTNGEPDERYAAENLARLQELAVERRIYEVKSKLQRLNPLEHADEYTALFGDLVSLEQYRRGLREQAMGEAGGRVG